MCIALEEDREAELTSVGVEGCVLLSIVDALEEDKEEGFFCFREFDGMGIEFLLCSDCEGLVGLASASVLVVAREERSDIVRAPRAVSTLESMAASMTRDFPALTLVWSSTSILPTSRAVDEVAMTWYVVGTRFSSDSSMPMTDSVSEPTS